VKDLKMHSTKRELHSKTSASSHALQNVVELLRQKELWAGFIAVGIILAIVAPFGTDAYLRLVPAMAYWTAVASVTFLSASVIAMIFAPIGASPTSAFTGWIRVILTAGAIGLVVAIEVLLLNWAVFDLLPTKASYALPLTINTVVITIVIFTATRFISKNRAPQKDIPQAGHPLEPPHATPPALLARLPFEKRGAMISISVQDHYVDVTTTKGNALILMRLTDAMLEAGAGFQTHRSHWVAADQIKSVRRDGPKAVVTTQDGRDIPVSRTYVPHLKEAGLLL
jgi:hypothetical protein